MFVGSKDGLSESSFGHIALRFSPTEKLGPFDSNIQFVAKLPQKEFILKKYAKGFGLFGNFAYDVAIELNSFTNYKSIKIREEDRDVYVLPLALSSEQIDKLIHYIDTFYDDGIKKYRFFNKNCSYFAVDALEFAIGRDIKAKSFPWRVADTLRSMGLIKEERYFPSNSNAKKQITAELYQSALSASLLRYHSERRFLESLESENINIKSSAYFSLLAILKSARELGQNELELMAEDYYLKLGSKESEHLQSYFKAILMNRESLEIKRVTKSHNFHGDINGALREIETDLTIKRKKPSINISWRTQNQQGENHLYVTLDFLDYNQGTGAINYRGQTIARHIITRKNDWVVGNALNYSVHINARQNIIESFILLFQNNKTTVSSRDNIIEKGHLALNNLFDFNQADTLGACLAMVKLQKALFERVSFNPQATWNADIKKTDVLDEILAGKFAIVPGFENINDFTASIPKDDLKNYVMNLQQGLNNNPRKAFLDGLFEYQEVKRKTFKNLVFLLNAGHPVELVVGMKKVGSRRYEQVSHVVLVHKIMTRQDGNGYDLFIYDPNLGHITIQLTKNYTLNFPSIYRTDLIYNGILYKKARGYIEYDLGMRSLDLNIDKLKRRSSRGRPLFYDPLDYSF